MLSRILKPPLKESKKKGGKDDVKDGSLHEQLKKLGPEDLASPRTPRTPRLERARNLRWHLVELDKFEDIARRSFSSYNSLTCDTPRQEPLSPTLLERVSISDVDKKVDNKGAKKHGHCPLPALESSPENTLNCSYLDAHRSSQGRQAHTFNECDDGNETSSEYSAASSAGGSPPRVAEPVGVGWEGPASSFKPRTKKKKSTIKRLQVNGLDKISTVSLWPPVEERIEVERPGSLPPIPSPTKAPDSTCPLVSLPTSDVARPIPHGSKGIHNTFSGPICVQEKRDQSPHQSSRNPLVSPRLSDVARPNPRGTKGVHNNFSAPLCAQEKTGRSPQKSPMQSPGRSPLTSPNMTLSPQREYRPGCHDDVQTAHPLPLPWPLTTAPVSPRSNTSSAERSEDSCRVESPLLSARWLHSPPGRADPIPPIPSGGRWLKGALLGSGSFGKVYRGHHSETGDMCAIKEVEIVADDPRSKESAKQLAQEIALLSTLRHPNILHYKGSEMVGESLYIYLELVSGGSIYRLLQEFNCFAEPVIRRYTRQILLGLQFLHERNTVHRDIKCANMLVDQDGRVKLADFGMAKLIGKETAPLSFKGSPYWMAPEVILQNNSGFECAVDIWSLGCTVIEMATGKPPWFQYEGYAAMFKVMNCHEVPIPDALSPCGKNFVSLCLQRDPAKRLSASRLLEHPFVQVDKVPSYWLHPVSDNLSQGMNRSMPTDSEYRFGAPPQAASREPTYRFSNGAISPRPSRPAHMPTSRSAVQLSDYSRPRPGRGMRRLGQLTDTEDYASHYEDLPVNHAGVSNRNFSDIHGLHAGQHRNHGLDSRPPTYTLRN